jgi:hypothetical protein
MFMLMNLVFKNIKTKIKNDTTLDLLSMGLDMIFI